MVFRYCFGMIMSVSTLMIFSGAATPSSVVNLSMCSPLLCQGFRRYGHPSSANSASLKGPCPQLSHSSRSFGLGLDGLHVVVGEPEMVADLVHQDVADDVAARFLVLGPIIDD